MVDNISSSLFGYNKFQVNRLLKDRDEKIQSLEKQMMDIKEQLQKYVAMEQALKDGIVDARQTGNKIVAESNEMAEKIIRETNEQVIHYKEAFAKRSHNLVDAGMNVRGLMNEMKSELLSIIKNYQEAITSADFDAIYPESELTSFSSQVKEYEQLEISTSLTPKKKFWDHSNMTDEEKRELEKLIHEVINNGKQGHLSESDAKIVKFANH